MQQPFVAEKVKISVTHPQKLHASELEDLCYATEQAIKDGIGFHWTSPPARALLENYWKGVLVVPERVLILGKLDSTVAGAVQLVRPGPTKQATAFAAKIEGHFVAPFARGHGLARLLLSTAEEEAKALGFSVLKLDVRETQESAIQLYLAEGWQRWGINPKYEMVDGKMFAGHFFYKDIG